MFLDIALSLGILGIQSSFWYWAWRSWWGSHITHHIKRWK